MTTRPAEVMHCGSLYSAHCSLYRCGSTYTAHLLVEHLGLEAAAERLLQEGDALAGGRDERLSVLAHGRALAHLLDGACLPTTLHCATWLALLSIKDQGG